MNFCGNHEKAVQNYKNRPAQNRALLIYLWLYDIFICSIDGEREGVPLKFLKHIKPNDIFNYVTAFLLIPFAVTLVLLFVYTAHTTNVHQ